MLATPITSPRAPRARASFGVSRGRPVVTVAAARPFADATLAGPVAQAEGRLGVTRFGRVAEEQKIRLRQRLGRRFAQDRTHFRQNFTSNPTPTVRGCSGTPFTPSITPVPASVSAERLV